jgi:large subunit ribosomal protein L4
MELQVSTLEGKKAGAVTVSDEVFGLEPREDLLQRMVRYQLAKRQAGTHKVKQRSEIARTGAKFGRQKGGGRARHGSRRAPIFIGGGQAHGPQPRSHAIDLPKKVRALALRHALSAKAKAGDLVVVDKADTKDAKTAALRKSFEKLGLNSVLIVDGSELNANFSLASRNIPGVDVLPIQGINVYDILRRDKLVLTKAAVEALEARFK